MNKIILALSQLRTSSGGVSMKTLTIKIIAPVLFGLLIGFGMTWSLSMWQKHRQIHEIQLTQSAHFTRCSRVPTTNGVIEVWVSPVSNSKVDVMVTASDSVDSGLTMVSYNGVRGVGGCQPIGPEDDR